MRVRVPATECPRIRAEFLEEERRADGRAWFRQEYLCEFVDNGVGMFDAGMVERAFDARGEMPGRVERRKARNRRAMYYLGLDLGQKRDHAAVVIVDRAEQRSGADVFERSCGIWSGCRWGRRIRRWWSGCGRWCGRGTARAVRGGGGCDGSGGSGGGSAAGGAAGLRGGGGDDHGRGAGEPERAAWSVPKRDLIAGVQVLLEQGELRIAAGLGEAGALVRELLDVRITMAGGGRVRLGAEGFG